MQYYNFIETLEVIVWVYYWNAIFCKGGHRNSIFFFFKPLNIFWRITMVIAHNAQKKKKRSSSLKTIDIWLKTCWSSSQHAPDYGVRWLSAL